MGWRGGCAELEEMERTVYHLLNVSGGELADGVGDRDVGASSRCLFRGGDLENAIDIYLEDDFEDGVTGFHGRDWR